MRTDLLRLDRTILQEAREVRPVSARRFGANDMTHLPREHGLPALEVGQEIGALVIEELADGRIVLDLDGSLVEANNPGGLSAGQSLRLRVDLIEPQVTLQIVEPERAPEDEAVKFLRQHLPGPAAEQESLAGLHAKIETVNLFDATHASLVRLEKLKHFLADLLNSKEPLDTARLMRWVRDGGLHYEAKLLRAVMENPERLAEIADHDLKALLLGALGELETNRLSGAPLNAIVSQLGTSRAGRRSIFWRSSKGTPISCRSRFSPPRDFPTWRSPSSGTVRADAAGPTTRLKVTTFCFFSNSKISAARE